MGAGENFLTPCYAVLTHRASLTPNLSWDAESGPSVYNIPLGGGLFRQPWAIGGSGSTYIYGYCDATYEEGWGKERTIQFVRDGQFSSISPSFLFVSVHGVADGELEHSPEPRHGT